MYKPNKYELIFLLCITIERIGGGIFTTIPATCQLDFANLYDVEVSEVARILSARSFGAMAGSVVSPLYFYFQWGTRFLDPMTVCGSMMLIISVMIACAPLMPTLSLLFWDVLIANIFFGFLDLALQSIIIQSWGAKKSMPVVQFYHMLWGLGSIIAPYVTLPFAIKGEEVIEEICGIEEKNQTRVHSYQERENDISSPPTIFWSWLICACFWMISGFIGVYIGISRLTRNIKLNKYEVDQKTSQSSIDLTSEKDESEESSSISYWKYELILVIFVFLAYICIGGPEHWVPDLIYNYTVCVRDWATAKSSTLVSSFWFSYTAGRILGVFLINYIPTRTYLAVDITGSIVSYIILSIFSDSSDTIIWISTCTLGLFHATMYPTGVSLTGEYFDNTKLYSIIFGFGEFTGQMMVPLGADLALNDPKLFFIIGTIFCALYLVPMAGFLVIGNYFKRKGLLRPKYCDV